MSILGLTEFFSIFKTEYIFRNSLNIYETPYNLKVYIKGYPKMQKGIILRHPVKI